MTNEDQEQNGHPVGLNKFLFKDSREPTERRQRDIHINPLTKKGSERGELTEGERALRALYARKLTKLSEAEKFKIPELQEKGLVASTSDINGVVDKSEVDLSCKPRETYVVFGKSLRPYNFKF